MLRSNDKSHDESYAISFKALANQYNSEGKFTGHKTESPEDYRLSKVHLVCEKALTFENTHSCYELLSVHLIMIIVVLTSVRTVGICPVSYIFTCLFIFSLRCYL